MSQVINVDFQAKRKIESYTVTLWKCLICSKDFELDSRQKGKAVRVLVREANRHHGEECLCKSCSIDIANLVKKEGWIHDAD